MIEVTADVFKTFFFCYMSVDQRPHNLAAREGTIILGMSRFFVDPAGPRLQPFN